MEESDSSALAAQLRLVIGQLVRRVRVMEDEPFAHRATLGFLDRDGPMTTSDLAHAQRVRPQSMARTVGQLAEEGLVRFEPHPSDRRKTLVVLTESGREAVRDGRVRRAGWLHQAIASELTAEEQRVVAAAVPLLSRMAELPDDAVRDQRRPS
ncbi:MarR family transcriptional regulator [Actinocrinis puniceicyclus]|uniref:MarR family transcriptional regulator n=1 Tax=Actinocrinis puniceicyclus TaxID=977794 RepID=A0A8J8B9H2_9ACTN|nr:MarR family transcriptional regulator [Actinocrinis puniceicyclus]MBS2961837.1 MarR family transcriptional regulator [Actinocrinis puniceicyclus]